MPLRHIYLVSVYLNLKEIIFIQIFNGQRLKSSFSWWQSNYSNSGRWKKRGLVSVKKDIEEKDLVEQAKKVENIEKLEK